MAWQQQSKWSNSAPSQPSSWGQQSAGASKWGVAQPVPPPKGAGKVISSDFRSKGGGSGAVTPVVTANIAEQIAQRLKAKGIVAPPAQVQNARPALDATKEFIGQVLSYDAENGRGIIHCAEIVKCLGCQVYVHKNVLLGTNNKPGDRVRFKIHVNARGMPQAQAPLKPVPPMYVILTNFADEMLHRGAENLISSVRFQLQDFGSLTVEPYMLNDNEMTLAFEDPEAAEQACSQLNGIAYSIELVRDTMKKEVEAAEDSALDEFYKLVKEIKTNAGNTNLLDQSKQYLGVIHFICKQNGCAFINSEEVNAVANCMVYVHKAVFETCQVKVGDKVRFRIHLNSKGLPQAQRPLESVYEKPRGQAVHIAGFPEDWSNLPGEMIVEHIEALLAPFGALIGSPTLGYGGEFASAVFEEAAHAREAIKSLHGEIFKIRCTQSAGGRGRAGKGGGSASLALVIDGFPARWQAQEVSVFVRATLAEMRKSSPIAINVEILTQKGAATGSARVRFPNHATTSEVAKELADQKVAGKSISVTQEGGEDAADSGGKGGSGEKSVTFFMDELFMPQRPTVDPSPTDREVWVDPLPDEVDLPKWLLAFGDAEEVHRVRDIVTDAEGCRGYVRFRDHMAASRCVEAAAGTWSEAERVASSAWASEGGKRNASKAGASVYPINVIKKIMGSEQNGRPIQEIKDQLFLRRLRLRGEGVTNSNSVEKQLHFYAEGSDDALALVLPELEKLVAEIHGEIFLKIVEGWTPDFSGVEVPSQSDMDFVLWRPPLEVESQADGGYSGGGAKRRRTRENYGRG